MSILNNVFSPLEQFQIIPIYVLGNSSEFLTITNQTIVFFACFALIDEYFLYTFYTNKSYTIVNYNFTIVPSKIQTFLELIYRLVLSLVVDNIRHQDGQKYFPLIFSLFVMLLTYNLVGLLPYSYTITSQLIVTISISLSIFFGINIICINKHKIKFFCLFLPSGTSISLSFLLVPIELISYIFKPISLAVRLFVNMMAGHTLLKVIAGFACSLMSATKIFLFILGFIPLVILLPLFALEFGVALIQSFVFCILICIYLNDSLNLH